MATLPASTDGLTARHFGAEPAAEAPEQAAPLRRRRAAPEPPPETAAAAGQPPEKWPPYRLTRQSSQSIDARVLDFADRLFSADENLEERVVEAVSAAAAPAGQAAVTAGQAALAEAAQQAVPSTAGQAEAATRAEALAGGAASAYSAKAPARTRRAQQRREQGMVQRQSFEAWLEGNAEAAAAFQAAAEARGLGGVANLLLAHLARRRRTVTAVHGEHETAAQPATKKQQEKGGEATAPLAAEMQREETGEVAAQPSALPELDSASATAAFDSTQGAWGELMAAPETPAFSAWGTPPDPLLHPEAALDAALSVLTSLGIPAYYLPRLLRRCPALMVRQPRPEALTGLAELLGGQEALRTAAMLRPDVLLVSPHRVQRRIEVVALHTHCTGLAQAAAMVASHPQLLVAGEDTVADNARFLGSLLPARPYGTVLHRFPALLTGRLRHTLNVLEQTAPAELRGVGLELLASQQPTLLLARPAQVVQAWEHLRGVCSRAPAWAAQLAALTEPVLTRQEAAAAEQAQQAQQGQHQGQQHAQEDAVNTWFAEVYSSAGGDGDGGSGASSGTRPAEESVHVEADAPPAAATGGVVAGQPGQPAWFHQDPEGSAAAAEPGAFGTRQRPWQEDDRLRARALARLLDARRWQVQRLEFLLEEAPEQVGQQGLLDVVMASKPGFERRHPAFPGWLHERRAAEEAAQAEADAAAAAAREAAREAAAAVEAAALAEAEGHLLAAEEPAVRVTAAATPA